MTKNRNRGKEAEIILMIIVFSALAENRVQFRECDQCDTFASPLS